MAKTTEFQRITNKIPASKNPDLIIFKQVS